VPVEYELIRSISTVANDTRKRLGIVADPELRLMGGFSFQGMQPREMPKQLILGELEKQYRVEEVKLDEPIDPSKYDVLLAIQPSALGPQQLQNLVAAVKAGIPTAIFEDPLPAIMGGVPGTNQPKPAPGGMFGMGGQPPPKGNIAELWTALGIQTLAEKDAAGNEAGAFNQDRVPAVVVWQEFNPYPRFGNLEGLGPRARLPPRRRPGHQLPHVQSGRNRGQPF
jgi:ABC-2 type transport system permease protein